MEENPSGSIRVEPWMLRLKAAYDAGYYKTEAATGEQTRFPWQNRTCRGCQNGQPRVCLVRGTRREAGDATCRYFDPWNHPAAEAIIQYNKASMRPFGSDQAA